MRTHASVPHRRWKAKLFERTFVSASMINEEHAGDKIPRVLKLLLYLRIKDELPAGLRKRKLRNDVEADSARGVAFGGSVRYSVDFVRTLLAKTENETFLSGFVQWVEFASFLCLNAIFPPLLAAGLRARHRILHIYRDRGEDMRKVDAQPRPCRWHVQPVDC